jgi:multiple sugar transport system permease protein
VKTKHWRDTRAGARFSIGHGGDATLTTFGTMAVADAAATADFASRETRDEWLDRNSGRIMVMPAVVILLAFAIFPLIVSIYLSLCRFALAGGSFTLTFIGLFNYKRLLFGSQQYHLIGTMKPLETPQWIALAAYAVIILYWLARYVASGFSVLGLVGRLISASLATGIVIAALATIPAGGYEGTLLTTCFYVLVGVSAQFLIGLSLALLCAQPIRGRNFFRVVFFIPLMVTPVGVAYMFRMMADMQKGPFAPLSAAFGLTGWSWATQAWSARLMVLIGDTWQWTPFMFIVLLAAIENQPRDQLEAARLDGANGWQVFRDITWPSIAPIAATVVLIRLIEAFKIIDIPNVLTAGGPGLATESMTLHAFIAWRTQDLGGSAAIGYLLLFVSTVTCVSFFNYVVRWTRRHQ